MLQRMSCDRMRTVPESFAAPFARNDDGTPGCDRRCARCTALRRAAAGAACLLATAGLADPRPASAQAFPNKPVRIISPFEAGGSNDGVIRPVAPRMAELLGVQVLVENRPGAGGVVGSEVVARSAGDGYTLLVGTTSTHAINPALRKLPYDAERDFSPVGLIGVSPYVMLVNPSVPVKTVKEMIALARKKPGAIEYGSGGIGTPGHLAGAVFARMTGTELVHIPYKSGASSITDAVAGRISMVFTTMLVADSLIEAGRVRALGVTTRARLPRFPQLPTVDESGLPGYEFTLWLGLLAPAKTPEPAIARLTEALAGSLREKQTQDVLAKQSVEVQYEAPKTFSERIRRDLEVYAKVIRESGLKAD
jgi:tripartite-type tricarboxylate transporter receptor subunit TctC